MILAVAATQFEMDPFLHLADLHRSAWLISGVGPMETSLQLTRYLERERKKIAVVVQFGVAGVYLPEEGAVGGAMPELLDLCLAEKEVYGDLGICFPKRIDDLPGELAPEKEFFLTNEYLEKAADILRRRGWAVFSGNFVTVCCASGTRDRGEMLRRRYDGLCENMEGAAAARVCAQYDLPLVELRCISNTVDNRDTSTWRLLEACGKAGAAAAQLVQHLRK